MKIFKQVTLKKVTQGFLFSIFYPVDETNNYIWWEKKDLQTQILAFATSMARTLIKRLLCSCFYISKVGRHFWRHSSIPYYAVTQRRAGWLGKLSSRHSILFWHSALSVSSQFNPHFSAALPEMIKFRQTKYCRWIVVLSLSFVNTFFILRTALHLLATPCLISW